MTYKQAVARAFILALITTRPTLLPSKHRHAARTSERAFMRLRKVAFGA